MNEVKKPRKPLIFYYALVLVALFLINGVLLPMLASRQVTQVDYGEFMRMTQDRQIAEVMIEDNQIVYSDQEGRIYKTGLMDDPDRTQRLYDSGAKFTSQIVEEMSPIMSLLISWVLPIVIFVGLGQYFSKKLVDRAGGGAGSMMFGMGKSNAKVGGNRRTAQPPEFRRFPAYRPGSN